MKVIFLDFDGVLNNYYPNHHLDNIECDWESRRVSRNFISTQMSEMFPDVKDRLGSIVDIDTDKIERLNKIIKETDARIVFSTSWRGCPYLPLMMCLKGFKYPNHCIGRTPRLDKRGQEIRYWLDNTDETIDNYLIIDDEDFDIKEYHDESKVLKVKALQDSDVILAIEKLNG